MTQNEPLSIYTNVTGWSLGYTVLNVNRSVYAAFTTTNMAEVGSTGVYTVSGGVTVPDAGGYIQVYKAPAGTELVVEIPVLSTGATLTTTWNGVSLPNPVPWDNSEDFIGQQTIVADGSMVTDSIASKRRLLLRWELITTAQRNQIHTLATTQATTALVLPGITSINVEPVRGTYRESPVGVTPVWNVSCEVRTTA